MEKSNETYKNSSKKNKYLIPIILVIVYTSIAVFITIGVKALSGSSTKENISFANNLGEEAFYNGKYESAITQYTELQNQEEWPIWNTKIAEVYSVKGDYKKSNEILQKAYEARNKIVDSGIENKEKDEELFNNIVLTYFLNGEDKKALEYGEFFLRTYPDDKDFLKTMFTVYLANNQNDKAKEIIKGYIVNEEDANDLATLSEMNLIIKNYDDGLKLLKQAWDYDKDELKIFDVIEDISSFDKNTMIEKILNLQQKDKSELAYNAWLAKIYSMDSNTYGKSMTMIKELEEKNLESINLDFVKEKIYRDTDEEEKANDILKDIENKSEDNLFISSYVKSIQLCNEKKYEDALKNAKISILNNNDYVKTYLNLIPEIKTKQQKSAEAEAYFRTAIFKEPYNYSILIKTAEYYKDTLKDSNKALYYYGLASKIHSNNPEIYYNMGLIQFNNQRIDEAIDLIKKSISLNSKTAKYYRTLGSIYLDKKENESAIKAIRNAYSIDEKDILTLNNAACYYVKVENDIDRAMTNIKAAYEGINENTKEDDKQIINDNYNRIKVVYDSSKKSNGTTSKVSEIKLFY